MAPEGLQTPNYWGRWQSNTSHTWAFWNSRYDNGETAFQWFLAQLKLQLDGENDSLKRSVLSAKIEKVKEILDTNDDANITRAGATGKRIAGDGWHDGTINIKTDKGAKDLYDELDKIVNSKSTNSVPGAAPSLSPEAQAEQAKFDADHKPERERIAAIQLKTMENNAKAELLESERRLKEAENPKDHVDGNPMSFNPFGGKGSMKEIEAMLASLGMSMNGSGSPYGNIGFNFENALGGFGGSGHSNLAVLI